MLKAVYGDAAAHGNLPLDLLSNSCLDGLAETGGDLEESAEVHNSRRVVKGIRAVEVHLRCFTCAREACMLSWLYT